MDFELDRIRELTNERQYIQKKTFTKWINSFLQKHSHLEVGDLFTDLADGKILMKLLEIISGEHLGKPNKGKLRVQKIENLNKCFNFLHNKVRLESIGAEDIVDGNARLILGLIWTIILRFQIQEIEVEADPNEDVADNLGEKRSAREALLLWCQRNTRGYRNCEIKDFSSSWRNGLGFCALIHNKDPSLLDYDALQHHDHIRNMETAFEINEKHFSIAQLLDSEDVDTKKPDDKSIMTYIASIYHKFSKMSQENKSAKRIENILKLAMSKENAENQLEHKISAFLEWILLKTTIMREREFPPSMEELADLLRNLQTYLSHEKPPKYQEKVELEAEMFKIFSLKGGRNSRNATTPSDMTVKKLQGEMEVAWTELEKEESRRNVAIRAEILRVEKMIALAKSFNKKAKIRETYIDEMTAILSDPRYGSNVEVIDASLKKHEAIKADILSRSGRLEDLSRIAGELKAGKYVHSKKIQLTQQQIQAKWQALQELLSDKEIGLKLLEQLSKAIRELKIIQNSCDTIGQQLADPDMSRSIDKVHIIAKELSAFEDKVNAMKTISESDGGNAIGVETRQTLDQIHDLQEITRSLQEGMNEEMVNSKLLDELDEIHTWIHEKFQWFALSVPPITPSSLSRLQEKQLMVEKESVSRSQKFNSLKEVLSSKEKSENLAPAICNKLTVMDKDFAQLKSLIQKRVQELKVLNELLILHQECNELETWLNSLSTVAQNATLGATIDESDALQRRFHSFLPPALKQSQSDFKFQAQRLEEFNTANDSYIQANAPVVQERVIPQVKALFNYNGKQVNVKKNEVMFLIAKTNDDWWSIRTKSGESGFVPKNYVQEVAPKSILIETQGNMLSEAIGSCQLESRLRDVARQLALLEQQVNHRGAQLDNHLSYLVFLSQFEVCDEIMAKETKLVTEMGVSKSQSGLGHLQRKIEDILSNDIDERTTLDPDQAHVVQSKKVHLANEWHRLVSLVESREKTKSLKVETDRVLNDAEELRFWIQGKISELELITQSRNSTSLSELQHINARLDNFGKELKALNDRADEVAYSLGTLPDRESGQKLRKELEAQKKALKSTYKQSKLHFSQRLNEYNDSALCRKYCDWAESSCQELEDVLQSPRASASEQERVLEGIQSEKDMWNPTLDGVRNRDLPQFREAKSLQSQLESILIQGRSVIDAQREREQVKIRMQAMILKAEDLLGKCDAFDPEDLSQVNESELTQKVDGFVRDVEVFAREHQPSGEDMDKGLTILKELCQEVLDTKNLIMASSNSFKTFDAFRLSAQEFLAILEAKMIQVRDLSFKNKTNVLSKLKRHNNLESEIRSSSGELRVLNLIGARLLKQENYRYVEPTQEALHKVNERWDELLDQAETKQKFLLAKFQELNAIQAIHEIQSEVKQLKQMLPEDVRAIYAPQEDVASLKLPSQLQLKSTQKNLELRMIACDALADTLDAIEDKCPQVDQADSTPATLHGGASTAHDLIGQVRSDIDNCKESIHQHIDAVNATLAYHTLVQDLQMDSKWVEEELGLLSQHISEEQLNSLHYTHMLKTIQSGIESKGDRIQMYKKELGDFDSLERKHKIMEPELGKLEHLHDQLCESSEVFEHRLSKAQVKRSNAADILALEQWCAEKLAYLSSPTKEDERTILAEIRKIQALEIEHQCYVKIAREVHHRIEDEHPNKSDPNGRYMKILAIFEALDHIQGLLKERDAMLQIRSQELELEDKVESVESKVEESQKRLDRAYNNTLAQCKNSEEADDILQSLKSKGEREQKDIDALIDSCQDDIESMEALYTETASVSIAPILTRFEGVIKDQAEAKKAKIALEKHVDTLKASLKVSEELENLKCLAREYRWKISPETWNASANVNMLTKESRNAITRSNQVEVAWKTIQSNPQLATDSSAFRTCHEEVQGLMQETDDFCQMAAYRKHLHVLYLDLDELLHWCTRLTSELPDIRGIYSMDQAQTIRTALDNVRMEIELQEGDFSRLLSPEMKNDIHSADQERLGKKTNQLMQARQELHMQWQQRKVMIDQIVDYNFFLRDCRRLDTYYSTKEQFLSSQPRRFADIDDMEDEIKQVKMIRANLANMGASLQELASQAQKLLNQHHVESPAISQHLNDLGARKERVDRKVKQVLDVLGLFQEIRSLLFHVDDHEEWVITKTKLAKELLDAKKNEKLFLSRVPILIQEVASKELDVANLLTKGHELAQRNRNTEAGLEERLAQLKNHWGTLATLTEESQLALNGLRASQQIRSTLDECNLWCNEVDRQHQTLLEDQDLSQLNCALTRDKMSDLLGQARAKQAVVKELLKKLGHHLEGGPSEEKEISQVLERLKKVEARLQGNLDLIDNVEMIRESSERLKGIQNLLEEKEHVMEEKVVWTSEPAYANRKNQIQDIRATLDNVRKDIARVAELPAMHTTEVLRQEVMEQSQSHDQRSALLLQTVDKADQELQTNESLFHLAKKIRSHDRDVQRIGEQFSDMRSKSKLSDPNLEEQLKSASTLLESLEHGIPPVGELQKEVDKLDLIQNNADDVIVQTNSEMARFEERYTNLVLEINHFREDLQWEIERRIFVDLLSDLRLWIQETEAKMASLALGMNLAETKLSREVVQEMADMLDQKLTQCIQTRDHPQYHLFRDDLEKDFEAVQESIVQLQEKLKSHLQDLDLTCEGHVLLKKIAFQRGDINRYWKQSVDYTGISEAHMGNVREKRNEHTNVLQRECVPLQDNMERLNGEVDVLRQSLGNAIMDEILQQRRDMILEWEQLESQMALKTQYLDHLTCTADIKEEMAELSAWITRAMVSVNEEPLQTGHDLETQLNVIQQTLDILVGDKAKQRSHIEAMVQAEVDNKNCLASSLKDDMANLNQEFQELEVQVRFKIAMLQELFEFTAIRLESLNLLFWLATKTSQLETDSSKVNLELHSVERLSKRVDMIEEEEEQLEHVMVLLNKSKEFRDRSQHRQEESAKLAHDLETKLADLNRLLESVKLLVKESLFLSHFLLECRELAETLGQHHKTLTDSLNVEDELVESCLLKVYALKDQVPMYTSKVRGFMTTKDSPEFQQCRHKSVGLEGANALESAFDSFQEQVALVEERLEIRFWDLQFTANTVRLQKKLDHHIATLSSNTILDNVHPGNLGDHAKQLVIFERHLHEVNDQALLTKTEIERLLNKPRTKRPSSSSTSSSASASPFTSSINFDFHSNPEAEKTIEKGRHILEKRWERLSNLLGGQNETLANAKRMASIQRKFEDVENIMTHANGQLFEVEGTEEDELKIALEAIHKVDLKPIMTRMNAIGDEIKRAHGDEDASLSRDQVDFCQNRLTQLRSKLEQLEANKAGRKQEVALKLAEAQNLSQYNQWMQWLTEIMSVIQSQELGRSQRDDQVLIQKHKSIKMDLDRRKPALQAYSKTILDANPEMRGKAQLLKDRVSAIEECWNLRMELYLQHLEHLKWVSEIQEVENWLLEHETDLGQNMQNPPITLDALQEALDSHTFMEKSLLSLGSRVDRICRPTRFESHLQDLVHAAEEKANNMEQERLETEMQEKFQRKETIRKTKDEKRRQERRRTQEIVMPELKQHRSAPKIESANQYSPNNASSAAAENGSKSFLMSGMLQKKNEFDEGHKKSTSRTWKPYYTVLNESRTLCFYLSQNECNAQRPAVVSYWAPQLRLEMPKVPHSKRKLVFRMIHENGSEFLLNADDNQSFDLWVKTLEEAYSWARAAESTHGKASSLNGDSQDGKAATNSSDESHNHHSLDNSHPHHQGVIKSDEKNYSKDRKSMINKILMRK